MPKKVKRKKKFTRGGSKSPARLARIKRKCAEREKSSKRELQGLTPKQLLFIREYVECLDGETAAIRAGYKPEGAQATACRLLDNHKVHRAVEVAQGEYAKTVHVSTERILKELQKIAFADPADYLRIGNGGRYYVRSWDEIPRSARGAIQEIKPTKEGLWVKLYSKEKALELLGKFKALFVDRHEVSGQSGGAIKLYIPENARGSNDVS